MCELASENRGRPVQAGGCTLHFASATLIVLAYSRDRCKELRWAVRECMHLGGIPAHACRWVHTGTCESVFSRQAGLCVCWEEGGEGERGKRGWERQGMTKHLCMHAKKERGV